MKKIKKDDVVQVIAGKDKGKQGKVLALVDAGRKVLVDGINMCSKHVKANPQANESGGILSKPCPLDRSNVMLINTSISKPAKVGIRTTQDGIKERYFKKTGDAV